jgi:hypothetical protein
MDIKSVISYREVDLEEPTPESLKKEKICLNCSNCFMGDGLEGKIQLYCNSSKDRPRSGQIDKSEEMFDYYDLEKYGAQQKEWNDWAALKEVSINGTCDNFSKENK